MPAESAILNDSRTLPVTTSNDSPNPGKKAQRVDIMVTISRGRKAPLPAIETSPSWISSGKGMKPSPVSARMRAHMT